MPSRKTGIAVRHAAAFMSGRVLQLLLMIMVLIAAPAAQNRDDSRIIVAGQNETLTVRWSVRDAYYIDTAPPPALTLTAPKGIRITPEHLEVKEKIIGMLDQPINIMASPDLKPGTYEIKGQAEYSFCSIREGWCKQRTRKVVLNVKVMNGMQPSGVDLLLEIPVPLDDEI